MKLNKSRVFSEIVFKSILLVLFLLSSLTHLTFAKDLVSAKNPSLYVKNSKSLKVRSLKAIVVNQNTGESFIKRKQMQEHQ